MTAWVQISSRPLFEVSKDFVKSIILIQCRTSSSRLPGKALLPVSGIASSVLCAKRAANTGLDVKVVTSVDASDDQLCEILSENQICFFRGDLNDVLLRFHDALYGYDAGTVVVRLTADNLFIDGALIEEAIAEYCSRGKGYLTLHPPALTGTPYGLSVEVFSVQSVRAAHREAFDAYDREHVTPWIIRQVGRSTYTPKGLKSGQSHLRCTMDTWSDYQTIVKVFKEVPKPVQATWNELCDILHRVGPVLGIPQRFTNKGNIAELALGTVQLGLRYGIANQTGLPSFQTSSDLIRLALSCGVTHLDCAADYGVAEYRLGQILSSDLQSRVTTVTKLSALEGLSANATDQELLSHVHASVYRSCTNLNLRSLPYLLLHRWKHRTSHEGRLWKILKDLKNQGVVKHLGASVQDPKEALEAIVDPDVEFIQLPFNLLDRRLLVAGFPDLARKRSDVVVQARSIFLQGLLVSPGHLWPKVPNADPSSILMRLSWFVKTFNRQSIQDLCVAYARSQDWIDCLVVGMDNLEQLEQNVKLFGRPPLSQHQKDQLDREFSELPAELLNPALWRTEN